MTLALTEKELELIQQEYDAELDSSHFHYKMHNIKNRNRDKPYYTNLSFLIRTYAKLKEPILITYIDSVRGYVKIGEKGWFIRWQVGKPDSFSDCYKGKFLSAGSYKVKVTEENDSQHIVTCISQNNLLQEINNKLEPVWGVFFSHFKVIGRKVTVMIGVASDLDDKLYTQKISTLLGMKVIVIKEGMRL